MPFGKSMTELKNAPILEAIMEIRWGDDGSGHYSFSDEEITLFPGEISASARSRGYNFHESVSPHFEDRLVPFRATHRFRKEKYSWPCLQSGLGVFTINQVKEGYSWNSFRNSIFDGITVLKDSRPGKLESIYPTSTLMLRYQNVFYKPESQSAQDFISKNFNIQTTLPEKFLNVDFIDSVNDSVQLDFKFSLLNPVGEVNIRIIEAVVSNKPCILLDTVVVSKPPSKLDSHSFAKVIHDWAHDAHLVQKHVFQTLVNRD
jgi:uncharacterized protein (TIGR04255 family)